MATTQNRSTLPGSDRGPELHGATVTGPVPDDERFEVTIRVRRQTAVARLAADTQAHGDTVPARRQYVSRQDYAAQHGASAADIAAIEQFARDHGLIVVESNPARRSVFLSGTAAQFAQAFGTTIEQHEYDGGSYRGRSGPLSVPADIAPLIEGVFGIDDRPVAKPHFQRRCLPPAIGFQPHAAPGSFTPLDLARLYDFPTGLDGSGQCIGLIELGGGYRTADIRAYFTKLGLHPPKVVAVRVDGARNSPSSADSADGEVMLDIEVAAAIAPKAKIAVYFAPNTDKGFLDALTMAIHDQHNHPSVISISWGAPESNWTQQAKTSFDQALQTAATLGVTVCAAAGDNGSGDGLQDNQPHVDFPASSPFMLACGGTKLVASAGAITSETVWNESADSATGGGISGAFPAPDYQKTVKLQGQTLVGRGVPDVAGVADPVTGYQVRVDGQDFVIGGTSAVAPLWAGLIALLNQGLKTTTAGFLNPLLYAPGTGARTCRDVTAGNNGAFQAATGWDPCTGWGSPRGTALLQLVKG